MTSAQSEIEALLDRRSDAAWAKDIEQLMSLYSPGVVYFDVVPPLQYTGSAALRERFIRWFGLWQGPIGQEIRDVTVLTSSDVAAAHMLVRASGTLKDGRDVGYWVRASDSLQRSDQGWVITHEHVSLPVDFQSRSAVLDLVP